MQMHCQVINIYIQKEVKLTVLFEACNLQSLENQLDREKDKDALSEKVDEIEKKMMEERESFGGKLIERT